MSDQALLIGNSDGIGLALTRALLARGWTVHGLSRSRSAIEHERYRHIVVDVRTEAYTSALRDVLAREEIRLVVYCAGIGEGFDTTRLDNDVATFQVNLIGLVKTVECALPALVSRRAGTLVGLSSMADVLRVKASPAYGASKAAMSHYLECVARAVRHTGVGVVNVRLGFVDTKMAKAPVRPWMLPPDMAAERILRRVLVEAPPARVNIPRRMAVLVAAARWLGNRL